ncbi:uncharacterized protein LOC107826318 isoform X1 [Nicotiana tabacum]|uniref:Guanylate-binding protein 1-like n=1 Tax=Nicotiana tabacum TaxID=4097 RepID=A0A1S4D659_TOBAC|nr:guanylate-binding protein 1-like [Nicotiana tomentosiformis]XP_016508764.1 PREDICTED: guanylate-binding protein 1-like [Nicotiana tabacum]
MAIPTLQSSAQQPSSSPSPSLSSLPSAVNIAAGPERAVRFVYCDEEGKFQIDPEALAILQLVKEPVGIVSVSGRARQGKSFLLNQLFGRSTGFQVSPTHRPCTKGIWLWSAPLRRTALDGTEYNLLLLDTEGINAYDQTGTHSTQILSLAVLLSSMFVYNQMGDIDEAAIDRLSLVTEMASASELGQFSPIFVWLLRDFYLDLVEDNRKITPWDYLELALRPVQGGGRGVAAKNEIRESIRALFPDRECFSLVRPLSNENALQRLDQIPLENLRPEFKAGLDALTRFVFERTRPKQVGGTVMTGPLFARITQSFLDALNNGAVPTFTSSWQSVEEAECQRAYDLAADRYMASFDRSKPPEEGALREAHENAAQKSMTEFNCTAVGAGSTRMKYEKRLQNFIKEAFEELKKDAFREAYLRCSNAIEDMEKELKVACHAPHGNIDGVLKVLGCLVSKYEATCQGPEKWRKLIVFIQQSVESPLFDLIKNQIDKLGSEKTSAEVSALKSITAAAEARLAAAKEQAESAQEEAEEWKLKYDIAVKETQLREDALRDEFLRTLADKDKEIKDKTSKLEQAEQHLATLNLKLRAAESKVKNSDLEVSILKVEVKKLGERLENINATAQSFERKARILEQEKVHLEQKYRLESIRFEHIQYRYEREAKRATALADKSRAEAARAVKEKNDIQRLAMERLTQIEKAERQIEKLQRQKDDLDYEVRKYRAAKEQAKSAQKEAAEWKRKYDIAVKEAKNALEKAASVKERANKETQSRKDATRDEFSSTQAVFSLF